MQIRWIGREIVFDAGIKLLQDGTSEFLYRT